MWDDSGVVTSINTAGHARRSIRLVWWLCKWSTYQTIHVTVNVYDDTSEGAGFVTVSTYANVVYNAGYDMLIGMDTDALHNLDLK